MNKQIRVTVNGEPRLAELGQTLSEIISGERPCGGHGKCGKCRAVARGELSKLRDQEAFVLPALHALRASARY